MFVRFEVVDKSTGETYRDRVDIKKKGFKAYFVFLCLKGLLCAISEEGLK